MLVITRYRRADNEWFVSEKDDRMSGLLRQPCPDAHSEYLAILPNRDQACEYAGLITRLHAEHPDKAPREIGNRAREIMKVALLKDPEIRARFKSFANTDEPDSSIVWEESRGQSVPARLDW